MRVTFFDVEYANTKNKSICQIGILSRDLEVEGHVEKVNIFVNPEDGFDNNCIIGFYFERINLFVLEQFNNFAVLQRLCIFRIK